jgi:hypothetical protein
MRCGEHEEGQKLSTLPTAPPNTAHFRPPEHSLHSGHPGRERQIGLRRVEGALHGTGSGGWCVPNHLMISRAPRLGGQTGAELQFTLAREPLLDESKSLAPAMVYQTTNIDNFQGHLDLFRRRKRPPQRAPSSLSHRPQRARQDAAPAAVAAAS